MKKTIFIIAIVFIVSLEVKAQDSIKYSNPLMEVRFNFFKKSVILFNEYLDTDSGSFNTTNFRVLYPIGKKNLAFAG